MTLSKENIVKYTITSILILLIMLSIIFFMSAWNKGHFSSIESLSSYVNSKKSLGPLVLTLIQTIQVVLPVLPGFFGCIVGSVLFGASQSFWINYIGISLGSIIAYWLARIYGVSFVEKVISLEKYEGFINWINKKNNYTLVLFLSILLPLAPDDFLCYFSGLIKMPAKKFTWIILLAKPWCILFYCLFFSYLI